LATSTPTTSPSIVPTPAASPVAEFTWEATSPESGFVASDVSRAPDGKLWVTDSANGRVAIFGPDGAFLESWGQPGDQSGEFNLRRPNGDPFGRIAFAPDGSFFVLDAGNRRVQAFDASRKYVTEWGGFGGEPGKYSDPIGIAVSPDGKVSVLDDARAVVETYEPDGTVVGSFDPLAGIAGGANGLATDSDGNLYVSTVDPNEVRRFDPAGNLTGTFGAPSSGPGAFSDQPVSIAVDADGRVYVTQILTSTTDHGVHIFAADGTFIGSWGDPGLGPGELGFPFGIALDGAGNAFVSEYGGDGVIPSADRLQQFRLLLP
jgi:DNA-binding beta-propeller fold protein YncE